MCNAREVDALKRSKHAAVFVPGLLGLGRLGELFYFDSRVEATLSAVLSQHLGIVVPVHVCEMLSMNSLDARQETLQGILEAVHRIHGEVHIHLVGHSTGGVDARLAASLPILSDAMDAIASVVTICAPHHGTFLANDPIARVLAGVVQPLNPRDWRALAKVVRVVSTLGVDLLTSGLAVASGGCRVARIINETIQARELIAELSPDRMATRQYALRPGVVLRSVVAVAPEPFNDERSDPLYRLIDQRLRAVTDRDNDVAIDALETLNEALDGPGMAINASQDVSPIDVYSHDGVVNASLQLFDPANDDELLALVRGDHLDVIGIYGRPAPLTPWTRRQNVMSPQSGRERRGWVKSGADFADRHLYELWGRIAKFLATRMMHLDP